MDSPGLKEKPSERFSTSMVTSTPVLRTVQCSAGLIALALVLICYRVDWGKRGSNRNPQANAGIQRSLVEMSFCNSAAPIPGVQKPRSFSLPDNILQECKLVRPPKGVSEWHGRNWCWAWIKHMGYYKVWDITWADAQRRVSTYRVAPPLSVANFDGLQHADKCERAYLGRPSAASASEIKAATEWLASHVSIYVINLPMDVERLKMVKTRLGIINIQFQRIEGVRLMTPNEWLAAKAEGLIPSDYNYSRAAEVASTSRHFQDYQGGMAGNAGCAAAHFRALHAAMHSEKPLALILEDDVLVQKDFAVKLRRLVEQEVPCDWDLVSLKSIAPYGTCISPHLSRVHPDGNEPAQRCRHGVNYGFFAMLHRVASIGKVVESLHKTVWDINRPLCSDIDVAMASISDRFAYYCVPSIQRPGLLRTIAYNSTREMHNKRSGHAARKEKSAVWFPEAHQVPQSIDW